MTSLDVAPIAMQILLPLGLLAWLAFAPAESWLGFLVQAVSFGIALLALYLLSVWMIPPWWMGALFILLWAGVSGHRFYAYRSQKRPLFPVSPMAIVAMLCAVLFGAWASTLLQSAIAARTLPPDAKAFDVAFPLGAGTYLVANGGAGPKVNGHYLTLEPKTPRQRAYRGQSFGVDVVRLDKFGLRASGWRPVDPSRYEIFGTPVFAPCAGQVLKAASEWPDNPVPIPDRRLLEGNHVLLDCSGMGILLAHLKQHSVLVTAGDYVAEGDLLGHVGNSGQSFEPHLHIHAQELPAKGDVLSGDPVFLTFGARIAVRSDLIRHNRNTQN